MSSRAKEKRRTPRIHPYVVPCQIVQRTRRRAAYLTDLGLRGARVALAGDPPAPGSSLVLELRIGRQVPRSRLRAVVKWVRAGDGGRHLFGLTFKGVSRGEQRALQAVVEEFQRHAAQIA